MDVEMCANSDELYEQKTELEQFSIIRPKQIAKEFDCAILNFSGDFSDNKYVTLDPRKSIQTKYGMVVFKNLIGKEYGSKHMFMSHNSKGFFYLLHLTPELWTSNLNHRTQILYSMDISMIVFELDLMSGSRVIETGTGSGSLSHSIGRAIAPNGRLITHDYSIERVNAANEDFRRHGIDSIVESSQRNVLLDGFAPECKEQKVDAVFLDLPEPWSAVKHAVEVLKTDNGRIACFCPCIEQVQRTCSELRMLKFQHIETREFVLRPYSLNSDTIASYADDLSEKTSYKQSYLKRKNYKYTHTGYLTFASYFG
ncbi:tRNA (adenine(58)-N(1))-methyltransferase catalytic subunit trmt61a-like [Convolutriloba macropyga]|uniref:tRNA (adenine(58)-N(1))-methyltransferase catalytic subunit trmt61a-like n=1 Tax=Convolutriloba macropyga TaxID=536237 RepID=UPI003F521F25